MPTVGISLSGEAIALRCPASGVLLDIADTGKNTDVVAIASVAVRVCAVAVKDPSHELCLVADRADDAGDGAIDQAPPASEGTENARTAALVFE